MVIDAIELRVLMHDVRVFYATELRVLMHDVRVFYARCASVDAPWARGRKGEGSDG